RVSGGLKGREVRVNLEDGGTLLVGRFDLAQSVRVLVNLVDNAHKYAPPGTPIAVTARVAGDTLEIAVADQGSGVPALEVERIFEPFYRAPGLAPDVGGTGLGLAISRQLARAQGGDIRYRPAAGGGSVFTLTLPAAQLPPALRSNLNPEDVP
ncbi:MAG: ATP-binding protein, partial [Gemmatimonadota bacterium]